MAYGGAWGFLGLFIVREDLRSHGLGGELWDHLLVDLRSRLRDDAPIGLDGVVAMQPFGMNSPGTMWKSRNRRGSGRGDATASRQTGDCKDRKGHAANHPPIVPQTGLMCWGWHKAAGWRYRLWIIGW